jgi:hypothetical protein
LNARFERTAHLILDKCEQVLDVLQRQWDPPPPLTPEGARIWRWTNDRFDLQKFCTKPACRRARLCKGEPRQCLTRHAPKIPAAMRKQAAALGRAHFMAEAKKSRASAPPHEPADRQQHDPRCRGGDAVLHMRPHHAGLVAREKARQ